MDNMWLNSVSLAHMIGRTISHYKILDELGAGGMGVVYKAHDTKLDRVVALKFLPSQSGRSASERQRFVQEAKAASGLDHPNICTIYEIDETDDGQMFIAMGYYDGESLASRLERGSLPIDTAINIATQVAGGLAAAHAQGIIHRDIKPANIVITTDNQAKIVDFGLAKLDDRTALTQEGSTVGTVSYMSPEQAQGREVDHRADVWALGVVLYEMITGRRPFAAAHEQAVVYRIINEDPSPIGDGFPAQVTDLITRALKRDPNSRVASMDEFLASLSSSRSGASTTATSRSRRTTIVSSVIAIAAIATFLAIQWNNRRERVNWARNEALPQVAQLISSGDVVDAFLLLGEAQTVVPDDPRVGDLRAKCARNTAIHSTPPGADVYFKRYGDVEGEWIHLGTTPIDSVWTPYAYVQWRVVAEGYETLDLAFWSFLRQLQFPLTKTDDAPEDMVHVYERGSVFAGRQKSIAVEPFWIDRYEITNRKYKEFIDAGGYRETAYWKEPFIRDGREIAWEQAMALFEDATGRPGPSTWAQGSYPDGEDDYPVRGVSWYEANAYADFAGKRLPTIHHWRHAAGVSSVNSDAVFLSNIDAEAPAPVGSFPGLGPYGTYDMAGNVKEWCWNEEDKTRYALGGDWDDVTYRFADDHVADPFARADYYGFRCMLSDAPLSDDALRAVPAIILDYNAESPVDDATFSIYRAMYNYDPRDLDVVVEKVDDTAKDWRREKVSFAAAYGDERVPAWIFIPRNVEPPYQCVVFFPGGGARIATSSENLISPHYFDYVPRSGRVLVYPVYQGTYERQMENFTGGPNQVRDLVIQWAQDVQRTVDYLAMRDDIDMSRLAYCGISLGSTYGPINTAVETRFAAAVYVAGGLYGSSFTYPPEVLTFNFLPRNTTPTLMVNGRYDFDLKLETSVEPMLRLLAAPDEDKHLVVLEADHLPKLNDVVRETLDWLDRYLGPVQ